MDGTPVFSPSQRFIGFACRMFQTEVLNGRPAVLVPIDSGWTLGRTACLLSGLRRELNNLYVSQGGYRSVML